VIVFDCGISGLVHSDGRVQSMFWFPSAVSVCLDEEICNSVLSLYNTSSSDRIYRNVSCLLVSDIPDTHAQDSDGTVL
jgi:hypothetical protein